MTFDPRKTDYLTPSQEAVYAFLSKTTYWRTVREVALSIGIAESTAYLAIRQLAKSGLVNQRPRSYGFDAGITEYKGKSDWINAKRSRARMAKIIGFEPLHVKLQRLLGTKRAREAEKY